MRAVARVDANQAEIVRGLRACGWSVHCTHQLGGGFPDLIVGVGQGGADGVANVLLEIKRDDGPPSARRLTAAEQEFHRDWRGPVFVVHSLDEAVAAVQVAVRSRVAAA